VDEQLIEALKRTSLVGMARLDERLRCVEANQALERLTGAFPLVGRLLDEILGDRLTDELAVARAALSTGKPALQRRVVLRDRLLVIDWLPIPGGLTLVAAESGTTFEEALAQLSARFIAASKDRIHDAIEEALRVVGETLGYARTAVFLQDPPGYLALHHEWCAPGVRSFKASMSGLSIAEFGWPLTEVAAGKRVVLDAAELPAEALNARRVLERDGLAMMMIVPLMVEQTVIGCVAFHSRERRKLSEDVHSRLRLISDIVAGALARRRAEMAQERAFAELDRLKTSAEQERDYLRQEVAGASEVVGHSPAIQKLLDVIDVVATTSATVLFCGESGVGKEVFARALHQRSPRRDKPLVKVNCASVPKELFESEFFGHVRGAFTGAVKDRAGRFELADGGTLFLDEIGEIPIDLQAKLLRVLQESEFERVGDDRTRKVDVRIVAATNRKLDAEVAAGRFRQDLYYRISVFPLEIPPLRSRREDVVILAEHFLRKLAGSRRDLQLTDEHRAMLSAYDWPGNVRELEHVIERAVILSPRGPLQLEQSLQLRPSTPPVPLSENRPPAATVTASPGGLLRDGELRALERENIVAALERAGWRIAGPGGAAELLGIRPSTLRDRMKSFGIHKRE
jgi:transcriptional regulator with GAF, ATPase, and Fis domain